MSRPTPPTPPQAAAHAALVQAAPDRYWTVLQTRQGWTWTCTHPACERADRGGYGCRLPDEHTADRAAQRHLILDHGDRP